MSRGQYKTAHFFTGPEKLNHFSFSMLLSTSPVYYVTRSKASLGKEQALQSPQKSLCLKEAQSLTPSGGSTLKHDIESREAEADVAEQRVMVLIVQVMDALLMLVLCWKAWKFSIPCRVSAMHV
ncbi:uncharacterized protein LOC143482166 isoform X2 [Brachyhypopomus gauderio]|uniref:uncharacterized protein LOC143482166 isoform X2 n=1 Tax=Brachyhypopomus gauderio TaxID=698409 RepID=UPI0040410849